MLRNIPLVKMLSFEILDEVIFYIMQNIASDRLFSKGYFVVFALRFSV